MASRRATIVTCDGCGVTASYFNDLYQVETIVPFTVKPCEARCAIKADFCEPCREKAETAAREMFRTFRLTPNQQ